MGLEPTTLGTTIRCSNQLSYSHRVLAGAELGRRRIQAKNLSLGHNLVNGPRDPARFLTRPRSFWFTVRHFYKLATILLKESSIEKK